MKIGCCLNMHSTLPDGIGLEWLEVAVAAGYDYIELPLAQMMGLDDQEFFKLHQRVISAGIPCEACNNFLPAHLKVTGRVEKAAVMDYAGRALERAARLGVQVVVFGSGMSRNVPDWLDMNEALGQLVDFLHSLIHLLEQFNITLVIEPLRVQESNIINSLSEAARLMKMVDHPRVKLLSDSFHMAFAGETPDILLEWAKDIKHAHFSRVEGRVIPTGELSPLETDYIVKLNSIECPRVSIESYSNNFEADSRKAIELIKEVQLLQGHR